MKYTISEIAIDLLRIYSGFNYEVGGFLFADSDSIIQTISFKKGFTTSISFKKTDIKLCHGVDNTEVVGTWHLHPGKSSFPSGQDKKQWKSWDRLSAHIINNYTGYSFYTKKGELINEDTFQKL